METVAKHVAKLTLTPDLLFRKLMDKFASNPTFQPAVTAHVRAKHGHITLPSFHTDEDITDAVKLQTYTECWNALREFEAGNKKALEQLKGKVPVAQAADSSPKTPTPVAKESLDDLVLSKAEPPAATPLTVTPVELAARPAPAPELAPGPDADGFAAIKAALAATDDPEETKMLLALLEKKRKQKQAAAAFSEERVREMIAHETNGKLTARLEEFGAKLGSDILDRVNSRLGEYNTEPDEDEVRPVVESIVKDLLSKSLGDSLKVFFTSATAKEEGKVAVEAADALAIPDINPDFVINDHTRKLLEAVHADSEDGAIQNILLKGPHGCGKTETGMQYAAMHGKRLLIVDCANIREARDLLVVVQAERGSVWYEPTAFVQAIEAGDCVIVLDELNRANHDIRNILMPVLDGRRSTFVQELKRKVRVGPGTVFFATMNEGHQYTGTLQVDTAVDDRFVDKVEVNYLPKDEEVGVLVKRTAVDRDVAEKLVDIANTVRAKAVGFGSTLTRAISTRQLLGAAKRYRRIGSVALTATVVNHFSAEGGTNSERAQILHLIQGKFPDYK